MEELTEAMFWERWPLTARRFSLTAVGLRDEDGWCPIGAVCRDLGIEPDPHLSNLGPEDDDPRIDTAPAPTPASSLGVRDAADVTPAADQSRGSVEGSGRRELPPGVTVALRFSRYRDFSFWLASNVPAVMFPSRGRAERAAIRAAEGD